MATKDKSTDEVARGAAVPAALAAQATTRDALLDPQPGDIIPDVETKGYHVGEVRQPAEPVLTRGGDVTFESLPEAGESKFVSSYAADFQALDDRTNADPAYAGVVHTPIEGDPDRAEEQYAARRAAADRPASRGNARSGVSGDTAGTIIDDVDADSAKVARKQAAEDKADK